MFGDFEMGVPSGKGYTLDVKPSAADVENIILATEKGIEYAKMKKVGGSFQFPILQADIQKLSAKEVNEDIVMAFDKFRAAATKELKVTENILYASGKFEIEKESLPVLEKVKKALNENPGIKLEVISHTDSQGDDQTNKELSLKRAGAVIEYLAANGIDRSRLSAIGQGEGQIRNRCQNGVLCSDTEHEYNRRTEFRFSK